MTFNQNEFITPRFDNEIIPDFVTQGWVEKCREKCMFGLLSSVARDYARIREEKFLGKTPVPAGQKKLYLATAGAPCNGKSTELDFEIDHGTDPRYDNAIFADPDRGVMEFMFTYRGLLSPGMKAKVGVPQALRDAYDIARPGSNIIANLLINEAYNGNYNIIHGTTLTAPTAGKTLEAYGAAGYERRLLLCYAPDDVRVACLEKRSIKEAYYQVAPDDFIEKGKMFPHRHQAYFEHGDHVILLWKPEVEKQATRAAEYVNGCYTILDEKAFNAYIEKYESDRTDLARIGTEISAWRDLEELYFARFENPKAPSAISLSEPKPSL